MILKTIQIKNFKCIRDSGEFRVEENVTCLVGKNESGKTSILQALAKLNPVEAGEEKFNILEYPRHAVSEYKRSAGEHPSEALMTTWSLSEAETRTLEELIGPLAHQISTVTISKGYDNRVVCDIGFDESAIAQSLMDAHGLEPSERGPLDGASDVRSLRKQLHSLQHLTPRQEALQTHLNSLFGDRPVREAIGETLRNWLPKFAYFSEYLQLPGQISVDDLKDRMTAHKLLESDKLFLAFLGMIGRKVEDLESVDQYDMLEAELEDASNRLTKEILRYWSQNPHMRVQFRFRQAMPGDPAPFNKGCILRIRIENTRHGTTTSFDERGSGFVWFFSFLGWFNLLKLNQKQNLIFLLDEPGLGLHALAQADLLRYFEERLAVNFQVIYTTHSPFMISPSNLHRVRTVEDRLMDPHLADMALENMDSGTRVGEDLLKAEPDTVFPLKALYKDLDSILKSAPSQRPLSPRKSASSITSRALKPQPQGGSVEPSLHASTAAPVAVLESPAPAPTLPEAAPTEAPEKAALEILDKADLLNKQGDHNGAVAAYDAVISGFGNEASLPTQRLVARALMSRGISMGQLGRTEDEIFAYNEIVRCYGTNADPELRKKVAGGLVNKAVVLGRQNQTGDALAVCDEVIRKYGDSHDPKTAEEIAFALLNKGMLLFQLNRGKEGLRACDEVVHRFERSHDPRLLEHVKRAKELAGKHRGTGGMLGWLK